MSRNRYGIAINLRLAGELARRQGRLTEAIRLLNESIEYYRILGNIPGIALVQATLGWAMLDSGNPHMAQALLAESLACFSKLNARIG